MQGHKGRRHEGIQRLSTEVTDDLQRGTHDTASEPAASAAVNRLSELVKFFSRRLKALSTWSLGNPQLSPPPPLPDPGLDFLSEKVGD